MLLLMCLPGLELHVTFESLLRLGQLLPIHGSHQIMHLIKSTPLAGRRLVCLLLRGVFVVLRLEAVGAKIAVAFEPTPTMRQALHHQFLAAQVQRSIMLVFVPPLSAKIVAEFEPPLLAQALLLYLMLNVHLLCRTPLRRALHLASCNAFKTWRESTIVSPLTLIPL